MGLKICGKRAILKSMNEFMRGMTTIGELSPPPATFDEYPPHQSAWQGVANSFAQAGYSLWLAMKEFPKNTQRESASGIEGN